MGDIRNEPSMEEILASIKRIIAEDGAIAPSVPRPRRSAALASVPRESQEVHMSQPAARPIVETTDDEEVLELTQTMDPVAEAEPEQVAPKAAKEEETALMPPAQPVAQDNRPASAPVAVDAKLVSESALTASRSALASLSALIVKPETNGDNTLDGLVRELLRPMLKEWLDARLPELVEQIVEKEVARITGRAF